MPILVCAIPLSALGQVTVTKARPPVIVTGPNPTAQESLAANELAKHLGAMLDRVIVPHREANPGEGRIVVGLASTWAPEAKLGSRLTSKTLSPERTTSMRSTLLRNTAARSAALEMSSAMP
ncbi:MAG: hypothetical protein KIS66_09100 [Fimbriimonadaceae bacterium]|nr:hypothetical protein [Fimbriimonadaceae bacterium]